MPRRIIHIFRAPVGGLFRHVRDLARLQATAGHEVGVVCDAATSDGLSEERLEGLRPVLALGLHRVPMSRDIGLGDVRAWRSVTALLRRLEAEVVHGHGAKGGAFARLAKAGQRRDGSQPVAFYTPHGGSLHYPAASAKGRVYMAIERRLAAFTDGIIFESNYSARRFREQVRREVPQAAVVPNGLLPSDFEPVEAAPDAADVLFVGELRRLKGVDVLIEAVRRILERGRIVSMVVVGEGPDRPLFERQVRDAGLTTAIRFLGARPAREAFALGRLLVVPSRAESLPYIVLEAAAARLPLIATEVGAIPDIVEGTASPLVAPGDVDALAAAILAALDDPWATRTEAERLRASVARRFRVAAMAAAISAEYERALARRALPVSGTGTEGLEAECSDATERLTNSQDILTRR